MTVKHNRVLITHLYEVTVAQELEQVTHQSVGWRFES